MYVVAIDAPEFRCALLQLPPQIERGLVDGPAGGEGGAAAAGHVRESHGVRVHNLRSDIFIRHAESLRQQHGEGGPLSADIDRSKDKIEGPIRVGGGISAGLQACVGPEAHRDAPPPVFAGEIRAVMRAIHDGLHYLIRTDRSVQRPVDAGIAFMRGVLDP